MARDHESFDFAQDRESFDFTQDRELVERLVEWRGQYESRHKAYGSMREEKQILDSGSSTIRSIATAEDGSPE